MKITRIATSFLALTLAWHTAPGSAQQQDSARIAELEHRIDAVTREIERLRLGRDVVEADTSVSGFGPAASKVYKVQQGVSVGGYGEVLYENFSNTRQNGTPSGSTDIADALRAIVYFGYKFNDRLLFNSEIEIEHADEASLEFAYIDYLLSPTVGVRAGLLLAPLGLVNELHEAPVFLETERSVTESRIIPTTWRENGIGLFGTTGSFAWRTYLMNSLDVAGFNAAGLRGGRQKGSKARIESLGLVARLDYVGTPGLLAGLSVFSGGTDQGRTLDDQALDGGLLIWDLHAMYRTAGWDVRGLLAGARLSDAAAVNRLNGLTGPMGVGEALLGGYLEAGYNILRGTASDQQLLPYVRYERLNTQRSVVAGSGADPVNELSVVAFGAAWKPVPQVVGKIGYQLHRNAADTGVNQWNIQLGWLF